jgi:hypothetical protein
MDKPTEIPKFDLAEQILAEQRKLSSVKRKGPGEKTKVRSPKRVEPSISPIEEPLIGPDQERIIAEIVARDIENLIANKDDIERESLRS